MSPRPHHQVGNLLRLRELPGRDRLRAAQVGEVRVVRIPATELILGLAHTGIALSPVVHPVANCPGDCNLAGNIFSASLNPQSRQYISYLKSKQGRKVSEYFRDFIDCQEGIDGPA